MLKMGSGSVWFQTDPLPENVVWKLPASKERSKSKRRRGRQAAAVLADQRSNTLVLRGRYRTAGSG
jgi:hypothetical protein